MPPARKVAGKRNRGPHRVNRRSKPPREDLEAKPHPSQDRVNPRYSYELSEAICERIANGETMTSVCRDELMPTWAELGRWRRKYPDFERRLTSARMQCCEYYADSIVDIADDGRNDYRVTDKGQRVFDRESFERSRLRVDTRKWTVSKLLRHVYGDKSEVDLRTPDGVNVKVEERNALIEAIVKLVSPKDDPATKPNKRRDEPRER